MIFKKLTNLNLIHNNFVNPTIMKGFYNVLELLNWGGSLKLKERSFRNLLPDEILVKVHSSPINPSDLMFIKGEYGDVKPEVFPIIPGFEGSGEIVEVGEEIDKSLIGRRVAVLGDSNTKGAYDGLWAEYHYTKLGNVLIFDKPLPYDKLCFTINPLTALGILDTIKKKHGENASILITGAAGNVGQMLIKLCAREEVNMICLVKNEDQETRLKSIGAQNIIKLNDSDCYSELTKSCLQINAKVCFDCLGGDYTSKILSCLPSDSVLYHFGNLEHKDIYKVNSRDFIFYNKSVKGWWLNKWLKRLTKDEKDYWMGYVKSEIQTNSDLFKAKIHEYYDLEEVDFAIADYLSDMSKGKILITPFREIEGGEQIVDVTSMACSTPSSLHITH